MGRRDADYIACPYYIGRKIIEDKPHIRCEGIIGSEATRLSFPDDRSRARHMRQYCYGIHRCKLCPIHKELDRKYGITDDI